MYTSQESVTTTPVNFTYESGIFLNIPWKDVQLKMISLIRVIMTIKTLDELSQVADHMQTKEYSDIPSGPNKYRTLDLFAEKILELEKCDEEIPLTKWTNVFRYLNSTFPKSGIPGKEKWSQILEKISPIIIDAHQKSPDGFFENSGHLWIIGFEKEILQPIIDRLEKEYSFEKVWKYASFIKTKFGNHSTPNAKTLQELANKKLNEAINSVFSAGLDIEICKKMFAYKNVTDFGPSNPLSKEMKEIIMGGIGKFLNSEINTGKPWEHIRTIATEFGVKTYLYHEKEIGQVELLTLQNLLKNYIGNINDKPFVAKISLMNMLQQEMLIGKMIVNADDPEKIMDVKKVIPAELPHLHNEVLRKAEKLFKQ